MPTRKRAPPREAGYPALHDELEALVNFGGLSPRAAIIAATLT